VIVASFPPLLLRAGLNYQRRHPWQALLALTGIVMGVAVVLAVDLANSAARAAFALSAEQLRGTATHRIIAKAGPLRQSLYTDLYTTPGHPPMAPVITLQVRIDGVPGRFRLLGLDIFAEGAFRNALRGTIIGRASLGEWLSRTDAVVLTTAAAAQLQLQPADKLKVRYRGAEHALEVVAVAAQEVAASRELLVTDIATAQAIAGMPGEISYIDLLLDEEAARWVAARLPAALQLVDIDEQNRGILGLSAAFSLNLTAMSLLALLVGVFLIFNAMSFSIVQRRNLMGRLRSLGVQPRELYLVILAESLVLGIIGTLIGVVVGIWLGQGLTGIVSATVSELYYHVSSDAMQISTVSLLKASLLGIAGTLAAAWLPARQASRTPPLTTLSRAAIEQATKRQFPRLAIAGIALVVIGPATAVILPGGVIVGFAGLFILLFGAVLITPVCLPALRRLLARLPLGSIWRMAVRDLDRHLSRLGTAAAALMVALAASVGVAVMVDSMRTSVSDWLEDLLAGDVYIAAEGFEDGALLPAAVVEKAPLLDTVNDYSLYRNLHVTLGNRKSRLVAARLATASRAGFEFIATAGSDPWKLFDGGGVLISEPLAHRLELRPGDELRLPTVAGDRAFTIAAIFRDFASEHGRVFIERQTYRTYWSDSGVNTLALFSTGGDRQALRQHASSRFSDVDALVFTDARAIYEESMAVFGRTFRITEALRMISITVAFVGILTALMALQLERGKEFAVLRALGLTRGQVSLLILLSSAILGLLAAIVALPTGVAMAWVLTDAIQVRAFGWTMRLMVSASPLLLTLLLGVGAALLAGLYPAWQASRENPAPRLRED
jgi:putative ABC transport system permease protein